MTKSKQKYINNIVLNARAEMLSNFDQYDISAYTWKRLKSCQAYVTENEQFFILRSYKTVVACIRKNNLQCYDFLHHVYGYTNTSAQHIRKFIDEYGCPQLEKYTYKEV